MSLRHVYKWIQCFKEGRAETHDDARSGRPSDALNEDSICAVRTLLEENRRYTITDLHREMSTRFLIDKSRTTIFRILTEALDMRKISARWVPRLLSDDDKKRRMGAALEFLQEYNEVGHEILDRVVTGDESWIHFWTPESKEQLKQWKKKEEETPRKCKQVPSAGKVMLTAFWDRHGVIYTEYHSQGRTVTAATYFDTILKLREAIKGKRPGLLTKKVWFFHDNAPAHGAKVIQNLLKNLRWDVFSHPAYSSDLAASDFHLFPGLKRELGGQRFQTEEKLKNAVHTILKNLGDAWYNVGIEKLVYRFNKCLDREGDYVEK